MFGFDKYPFFTASKRIEGTKYEVYSTILFLKTPYRQRQIVSNPDINILKHQMPASHLLEERSHFTLRQIGYNIFPFRAMQTHSRSFRSHGR